MTPEQFVQWLDGFLAGNKNNLNKKQTQLLKDKLGEVFNKVTPNLQHWHTDGTCEECGYGILGKNPLDTPTATFQEIMTGEKPDYVKPVNPPGFPKHIPITC